MAVGKALKSFSDYFHPRQLYLPKEIADKINSLEKKLFSLAEEFKWGVEAGGDDCHPDRDTWVKVTTAMHEEAQPLFVGSKMRFGAFLACPTMWKRGTPNHPLQPTGAAVSLSLGCCRLLGAPAAERGVRRPNLPWRSWGVMGESLEKGPNPYNAYAVYMCCDACRGWRPPF